MTTNLSGTLDKKFTVEEVESAARLKRLIRRRRAKMRRSKKIYMKLTEAKAVNLRKKMRAATSWL